MILNQMMKEKQSVEEQYSDLLSSYSILLEHNKNLTTKFDVVERERDELLGKTMQSSYYSPRADFDKPNLPKNKIDPIKRDSFREREIEVKNKPINITPRRERSLKNENKGVYQSPMPLKNSGIHQRARQLLIEELQDVFFTFKYFIY